MVATVPRSIFYAASSRDLDPFSCNDGSYPTAARRVTARHRVHKTTAVPKGITRRTQRMAYALTAMETIVTTSGTVRRTLSVVGAW